MLGKDRETAKRGMRIWYEEEFAQIEAQHKKELSINEAKYKRNWLRKISFMLLSWLRGIKRLLS